MFVSVKERARQIANGQFTASVTTTPATSPDNHVLESKPVTIEAPQNPGPSGSSAKNAVSPSKKAKPSKTTSSKEPAASLEVTSLLRPVPKAVTSKPAPPSDAPVMKKPSAKSKTPAESLSKASSPKTGNGKLATTSRVASQGKTLATPKVALPANATSTAKSSSHKTTSAVSRNRRSKSPPKRADSPIEDNSDPLSSLKSDCLKQVSGVTGLGGRRLAIVLKQRSSGLWYAALKDTGSGKYLKMWMNRDKTFASKEAALEAYLVFVTKMRNEVRWFPMSPRASSPKGKGQ
ncbi:hypothetical protein SVAN01_06577 [Stagonosporopsis vannaccii]|nr:hypothetical protein SVAN01_06577 [Stagonosporopsis vannaccii]